MGMLSVQDALTQILQSISPLGTEQVLMLDGLGRSLAEPLMARRQLPAWDNSAMDGYALRAADVQEGHAPLVVCGEIPAGTTVDRFVPKGHCARIFTGAPLPTGCDTVMIQENAVVDEQGGVRFTRSAKHGENVRRQGSDVEVGATILPMGRVITAGDIGLAVAQGHSTLKVIRQPTVAIFSTGAELIDVDAGDPIHGQIVNSNVWTLAAAVKSQGGLPQILPIVPDDYHATLEALKAACTADVVLSCGGMSVGDYDFVRDALIELTGDGFSFWKVAIKPGKPLGFGQYNRSVILGLPGTPASAMVPFDIFVRPALAKLQGKPEQPHTRQTLRCRHALKPGNRRDTYLRAQITVDESGERWVDASRNQSSGALSSIAGVDAYIVRPAGSPAEDSGAWVEVIEL